MLLAHPKLEGDLFRGAQNAKLGDIRTSQGQSLLWKTARQQNAKSRDFTVNALMYDPFSRIIFDYTDGVADCRLTAGLALLSS